MLENVLKDDLGDTHVTLKEPASFRWLSLEAAVKAIHQVYEALVLALDSEAATGSAEAKGILKSVKSVGFILRTAFLVDVLAWINKLCKVFQQDELNIDVVTVKVNATKDTLNSFKLKSGPCLTKTYESLGGGKYMDVKVTDTPQVRMGFQLSSDSYLERLVENIDNRFEEESMDKLAIVNHILHPAKLPVATSAIVNYGEEDLETVIKWLGPIEGHDGLVEPDRMRGDYMQFKMTLENLRGQSLASVCETFIRDFGECYPDFTVLAKYMLTAPLTSVACERGFSTQNRLKTKARSTLKHGKLSKLIRIVEEGSKVFCEFPARYQ